MYWEWKAKEGIERAMGSEKKRDEAREKAQISRLDAIIAGDVKARA